jgi:hypothetical protein
VIWHWFTADYWPPSWPNIFSPNIWTIAGILLHLIVTMVHRERLHRDAEKRAGERHEDLKQHVTGTLGGGS